MSIEEVFKTADDRLKSPFFRSFILSWMTINWKMLAILFMGSCSMTDKIMSIQDEYFSYSKFYIVPIIIALFYTLAFPFITVFFQWVTEKARIWASRLKYQREILESEDKEALAKIEFRLEQAKAGTNELKELNDQIGKLKEDLETKKNKNNQLQKEVSDLNKNSIKAKKDIETLKEFRKKVYEILKRNNNNKSSVEDFYFILANERLGYFKKMSNRIRSNENNSFKINSLSDDVRFFIDDNLIDYTKKSQDIYEISLTKKGSNVLEVIDIYDEIDSKVPF